jgi:hypothetical protein
MYIYTQKQILIYKYIQAYKYLDYSLRIKQLLVTSANNINQNDTDELYLSLSSSQYHLAEVLLYVGSTGIYRYLYIYICIHIYMYIFIYLPIIIIISISSGRGPSVCRVYRYI